VDSIKNILVPVDCTEESRPVLSISRQIAEKLDAHMHIVSVIDEVMLEKIVKVGSGLTSDLLEKSKEYLDAVIKEVGIDGLKYSCEVIAGVPFMEVISRSAAIPADLIMLGGMESDEPHRLGNDSFKIMRMAPFNTFAVKIRDKESFEEIDIKKILVALDFTKQSLMALDYALYLKPVLDSKVRVLQVLTENEKVDEDSVKKRLGEHISTEKIEQIDSFDVKRSKNPAKTILNYVDESEVDLLAIGSHSKKRILRNLFLGKVSYDVVRKVNSSFVVLKDPEEG
jgi:nucleotide-binding universal stress UspA family protein